MNRTCSISAVVLLALAALAGCEEKKTNLAPVASSLAPSTLPPASATVTRFAIDPESGTSIEMDAPKEKIRAATTGGGGVIAVDFANLKNTRGEVKMDLSTLKTNTFSEAEKNASQTMHARTWLEVADGESGKLEEGVKMANRYAVYAIRSVENASAAELSKVTVTKDGADEVRVVGITTKGDLLLHGHKVDRAAEVEVTFRYDPGAAADKPKGLSIKSKKPLRVVLADHDVKPRDGFGKIARGSFHLLGTKVADDADISLNLRAKPQS